MTKRIFKYTLDAIATQTVYIPGRGRILHLGVQNDFPVIWVEVVPDLDEVPRVFHMLTTGDSFNDDGLEYIGTFEASGWFIGHIYEQVVTSVAAAGGLRASKDFAELRREGALEGRTSIDQIQSDETTERLKLAA